MTCRYRVAKKQDRDPIADRIVEVEEVATGVRIWVNGVRVAKFRHGCDHLEVYVPVTEQTGLKADRRGLLLTQ